MTINQSIDLSKTDDPGWLAHATSPEHRVPDCVST